jgi:hypothetical protein
MTKLLVVAVAAASFLALGGPSLVERLSEVGPDVSRLVSRDLETGGESAAQISAAEFLRLPKGAPMEAVRARLGEAESKHRVAVERVQLDCWYYGIAGARGAYQLCFVGGRLSSKTGFGARA